jgi:hypothetical protein
MTSVAPPPGGGINAYRSLGERSRGSRLGPLPSTPTTEYVDAGVLGDGALYYYRLQAVDACGLEGP